MSNEINLSSIVLPKNNGYVEPQPPVAPPQVYPTIVQPIPPAETTQVAINMTQMVPPHELQQAPTKNVLSKDDETNLWFKEMRGWIMVVAVLVASVTYSSGLNPPGGFWQDDNGHEAGTAIMHSKSPNRYTTFFYANATAYMASLVIIILFINEKFYSKRSKVIILNISMVLGLVSMMIAYAAGCARKFSTSIYVIVLAVVVLLFVISSEGILKYICLISTKYYPPVENVVGPDFVRELRSPTIEKHDKIRCSSV